MYSVTSFYCTRVLAAHSVKAQKHDSGPSVTSTSKHSLFKGPLVKLLFSLLSILLFTYSKLNHLSQSLGFQALNIFYSLRHKAETSQCFFDSLSMGSPIIHTIPLQAYGDLIICILCPQASAL